MKASLNQNYTGYDGMKITWQVNQDEINANHRKLVERFAYHKKFGMDRVLLSDEIVEKVDFEPENIIEIGSGKGGLTLALAEKFGKLATVDNDRENLYLSFLNAAYARVEQSIEFILCSAESLPYEDNCFDLAVSSFSFHHFNKPFVVLDEMIRVTRKTLIISDFNPVGFQMIDEIHHSEGRRHDTNANDFSVVGEYLKDRGFDVREYDEKWQKIYAAKR